MVTEGRSHHNLPKQVCCPPDVFLIQQTRGYVPPVSSEGRKRFPPGGTALYRSRAHFGRVSFGNEGYTAAPCLGHHSLQALQVLPMNSPHRSPLREIAGPIRAGILSGRRKRYAASAASFPADNDGPSACLWCPIICGKKNSPQRIKAEFVRTLENGPALRRLQQPLDILDDKGLGIRGLDNIHEWLPKSPTRITFPLFIQKAEPLTRRTADHHIRFGYGSAAFSRSPFFNVFADRMRPEIGHVTFDSGRIVIDCKNTFELSAKVGRHEAQGHPSAPTKEVDQLVTHRIPTY